MYNGRKIILNSYDRVDLTKTANDAEYYLDWQTALEEGTYLVSYSICKQIKYPVFPFGPTYDMISPLGLELYYPFTASTINADGVSIGNLATGTLVYDSTITGLSTITADKLSTLTEGPVKSGLLINRSVTSGAVATISLWFKCTSIPRSSYFFITTMQNSTERFFITIDPTNKLLINTTAPFTWVSTFTVAVNTTYHLVVVLNNGVNSLYINGVFNSSGLATVPVNTGGLNSIMRDPGGLGLLGTVDDYRYYSRALTLPEITRLSSVPP